MERGKLLASYGWELVAIGAHDLKYKVEWKERRYAAITSFRKQLLDPDNLVGGAKLLVDALVDQRLLFDDSKKYTEIIYSQEIDTKDPRTEIKIFKEEK